MADDYSINAKITTEFIGTFFLCLTICISAAYGLAGENAPFAIAGILMVMIYAGGHVSGAHFNPAVTISIFIRGACDRSEVAPYIVSQLFAGASAAILASKLIFTGQLENSHPMEAFDFSTMPLTSVIASELLFTFALVFVILNVATSDSTGGNQYFGLAIALVVLAGAMTVGPISLASFNPAVSFSLSIVGKMSFTDLWLHLLPQILGGVIASYLFVEING
ncbi:MAG: porin [Euryarchaeota archaeon]|nr:porin [Euryarchaeota archaeon]|tara:strand:- start:1221 stop:1886 length:666 start_codon:yes stop_codon:yes gene_type:complete